MEKKELEIGTCLYTVPEYKDQSPRISEITHMDAGILGKGLVKRLFDVTEAYYERDRFQRDLPNHADGYDAIIDSDYFMQMLHAEMVFNRDFKKAVSPIVDWSYMHYGHIPCCDAKWKGEVNVGDTFMGFCTGCDLAVYKITNMEYSDPHGVLHSIRERDRGRWRSIKAQDKEPEWPMEGICIEGHGSDLQESIYRSRLIHPIDAEIFDKALEACMAYRNSFDNVVREIREQYGLPEVKDKTAEHNSAAPVKEKEE